MERRMRNEAAAAVLKKGPWTAEEDEVLLEYVRKHGPQNWSSIRSKGLLPRSGKSCRLRWVNKLRPNLKTGCKFTSEEERTVVELQAKFGNKWARIATYLPGRTDNDVKNFWSTRKKRLARILRSKKSHAKPQVLLQGVGEECENGEFSSNVVTLMEHDHFDENPTASILETQLPEFHLPELPESLLDMPLLPPEGHEAGIEFADAGGFLDPFGGFGFDQFHFEPPFPGIGDGGRGDDVKTEDGIAGALETLFDDFPVDMFD